MVQGAAAQSMRLVLPDAYKGRDILRHLRLHHQRMLRKSAGCTVFLVAQLVIRLRGANVQGAAQITCHL
jgi:hypothetical protein